MGGGNVGHDEVISGGLWIKRPETLFTPTTPWEQLRTDDLPVLHCVCVYVFVSGLLPTLCTHPLCLFGTFASSRRLEVRSDVGVSGCMCAYIMSHSCL